MNEKNIFEIAVRSRMRFPFKGQISVEDLWDLSVEELDSIFKVLNSKVKQTKEESLLNTRTVEENVLETQIEIIKHIVKTKQEEAALRLQAREIKEQRQKILSVLKGKKEESLQNKTEEELLAMLEELGK